MHTYLREQGYGNTDAGRAAWSKLTDAQRKRVIEEGMRKAGIPESYIKKYISNIMEGDEPGVNRSQTHRRRHGKRDISKDILDQQRKIAKRCGNTRKLLPRGGSVGIRTLIGLGATEIAVGSVTFGYYMYLDRGEELLQEKAEEAKIAIIATVLKVNLMMLHLDGLLPLTDFIAVINGERVHFEWHKRNGQSSLAAWVSRDGKPVILIKPGELKLQGGRPPD
jgi:hypothetical protein